MNWKGEQAGIAAIHKWIKKRKPKPDLCEICNKKMSYPVLMNIDHNYKRIIEDFKWVCKSCHQKYDFEIFGSRGG